MAIQKMRGLEISKPVLLAGQVYFSTDTEKLFIGKGDGTDTIIRKADLYYLKTEIDSLLSAKADTTYVNTQIANLIAAAPATLDTLNELAVALGNDPNFATTITNLIATKEPANANIQAHISSILNPHSVTKTQVGLSNVDNISDVNKPVSTAQQTALDGKVGTGDPRLTDTRTPTNATVNFLKLTGDIKQWLINHGFQAADQQIAPHISLPNNFAIANTAGIYSWFVKINRFNWDPTNLFSSSERHPAFTVNQTPSPVNATFTAGSGTLPAGTYYYRVTALAADGTETLPSAETSLALASTGGVNVNWGAVTGATGYKIYGRSTGAELLIATAGNVTTYLDNGSITPAGAMPITNSTGEKEIYVGKYQACLLAATGLVDNISGIYAGSRAFVQQFSNINFDNALAKCAANNGNGITGFHLMTNAEWAALQIKCIAGATQPFGNTNYGRDDRDPSIVGRCYTLNQFGVASDQARWLTGSGGIKTSHNFDASGVYDLNGNVWEWIGGMRLNNGEINILVNNNAGDATKDQTLNSAEWKAILRDGTLVAPGTADTLKFDVSGNVTIAATSGSGGHAFETQTLVSPVVNTDAGVILLKKLAIIPYITGLNGDNFWYNNGIESISIRGGDCGSGGNAGVSALYLDFARTSSGWPIGFRLAFAL